MNALIKADLTAEWCVLTLCALAIVKQLTHSRSPPTDTHLNIIKIALLAFISALTSIYWKYLMFWCQSDIYLVREVPVLVKILSRRENKIPFESKSKQRFDKLSQMTNSGCFMSKLSLNPNTVSGACMFFGLYDIQYHIAIEIVSLTGSCFPWEASGFDYLSISNSVRHAAEQHSSSVFGWTVDVCINQCLGL